MYKKHVEIYSLIRTNIKINELGTRYLLSFATATTRQCNTALGTRTNLKNVWGSQCLNGVATTSIVITNNEINDHFDAWKLGHVVAAVLSSAQLCNKRPYPGRQRQPGSPPQSRPGSPSLSPAISWQLDLKSFRPDTKGDAPSLSMSCSINVYHSF